MMLTVSSFEACSLEEFAVVPALCVHFWKCEGSYTRHKHSQSREVSVCMHREQMDKHTDHPACWCYLGVTLVFVLLCKRTTVLPQVVFRSAECQGGYLGCGPVLCILCIVVLSELCRGLFQVT